MLRTEGSVWQRAPVTMQAIVKYGVHGVHAHVFPIACLRLISSIGSSSGACRCAASTLSSQPLPPAGTWVCAGCRGNRIHASTYTIQHIHHSTRASPPSSIYGARYLNVAVYPFCPLLTRLLVCLPRNQIATVNRRCFRRRCARCMRGVCRCSLRVSLTLDEVGSYSTSPAWCSRCCLEPTSAMRSDQSNQLIPPPSHNDAQEPATSPPLLASIRAVLNRKGVGVGVVMTFTYVCEYRCDPATP